MSFSNVAYFALLTKFKVVDCPECEEACVAASGMMHRNMAFAPYNRYACTWAISNCGQTFCSRCRGKMARVTNGMRHVTDKEKGYALFRRVAGKTVENAAEVSSCTCMNCEVCAEKAAWHLFSQVEWIENP